MDFEIIASMSVLDIRLQQPINLTVKLKRNQENS